MYTGTMTEASGVRPWPRGCCGMCAWRAHAGHGSRRGVGRVCRGARGLLFVNYLCRNMDNLLAGAAFGTAALGYYCV